MVTLHLLPALGLVTVRASLTGEGRPVSEVRLRSLFGSRLKLSLWTMLVSLKTAR